MTNDIEMRQRRLDFYRMLADTIEYRVGHAESDKKVDNGYVERMIREGLFHKDQEYKNVMFTIGDETRYVPFALAHTNTDTQIVILPPERMPYEVGWNFVLNHEREHCLDPDASEHYTDLKAAIPARDYRRSSIRVKY